MEITLKISEKQYKVMLEALDLYGRLMMGQTCIINEKMNYNGLFDSRNTPDTISKDIALRYFPDKNINGVNNHLGISNTCENGKISMDIYAHLRYNSGLEKDHSVWKNTPINHSKENIDIKIEK